MIGQALSMAYQPMQPHWASCITDDEKAINLEEVVEENVDTRYCEPKPLYSMVTGLKLQTTQEQNEVESVKQASQPQQPEPIVNSNGEMIQNLLFKPKEVE